MSNYYTNAYGENIRTYQGLLIINYANGEFEVFHNGKKEMCHDFHYDETRNGEYILPNGEKRIYTNGVLVKKLT